MPALIQFRRDTAANWTSSNPTLANGEMGLETDTNKFKIGNGSTVWSSLTYGGFSGTSGFSGYSGISGYSGFASTTGSYQIGSLGVGTAASGTSGEIRATNNITAYYSDKRLKQVKGTIKNALQKVMSLAGVEFTQNKLAEQFGYFDYKQQVGVIAQDVEKVLPEVIQLAPFDIDKYGNSKSGEKYLTVQYEKIVPLLIEAIKEQQKLIEELKKEIDDLK